MRSRNKYGICFAAVVLALLSVSGRDALAQTTDPTEEEPTEEEPTEEESPPELFQNSTLASQPRLVDIAVRRTLATITARTSQLARTGASGQQTARLVRPEGGSLIGKPAGEIAPGIAGWGSFTWTGLDQDGRRTDFDGDLYTLLFGADYGVTDRLTVGASLGYERVSLDTDYNRGRLKHNGFTVAPYGTFVINQNFAADFSIGYTRVTKDTKRAGGVDGDTEGDRFFAAANLNAYHRLYGFNLQGIFGYSHAIEDLENFTESDGTRVRPKTIKLGQAKLAGRASYPLGDFEPFLTAQYQLDLVSSGDGNLTGAQRGNLDDRDDFTLGLGFDYVSGPITATFEGSTVLGRTKFDSTSAMLNVRYSF